MIVVYTASMHKKIRLVFTTLVIIFAIIGFVFVSVYFAMKFKLTNTLGIIDTKSSSFAKPTAEGKTYSIFPLAHTPEWNAFKQAVVKDKVMIDKVSKETGVPPRLLIAILVPEQMRLFHSERAVFKRAFEPLKILGSQSQFSFGIYGIKDETARAVEAHLVDKTSPFYLGPKFEHALDFSTTTDIDKERFERIIDEHNHLYSYRYTALYVAQIESQWKKAGFPIVNKPAVIATLWNLGFTKSKPNANPKSGGAAIDINGVTYSFGALADQFYYSDELIEIYP
jgi:hypothetical protein